MDDHKVSPLNPVPMVVWALVLPMIALEVVLSAGEGGLAGGPEAIGGRSAAVQQMAYSPDYMRAMVEAGQYPLNGMWRLVGYPFVHVSVTHLLFVAVFLLALGKFVGEAFRWWAVLALFVVSGVLGALIYTFALPGVQTPLVGGWVPVYGLIGGVSFILWQRLRHDGAKRWRAFSMIGMLLLFRVLLTPVAGWSWDVMAEVAGFAVGFGLSYLVSPGGARAVMARIRQR